MNNIQQLIEQAMALMTCPTCGRHYVSEEIKFKGLMDHTYILQASCERAHPPIFTTWITSYAPTLFEETVKPIDNDHVIALHQALEQFNGDFRMLWPQER